MWNVGQKIIIRTLFVLFSRFRQADVLHALVAGPAGHKADGTDVGGGRILGCDGLGGLLALLPLLRSADRLCQDVLVKRFVHHVVIFLGT